MFLVSKSVNESRPAVGGVAGGGNYMTLNGCTHHLTPKTKLVGIFYFSMYILMDTSKIRHCVTIKKKKCIMLKKKRIT